MTWHENIEDFGEEVQPDSTFRFECHPGLSGFGTCCATDVTLTPYDIARMRRHLGIRGQEGTFPTCQHLNLTKNTDFRWPVSRPAIRVFLFN
jgi:hypothetical protein